MTLPKLCANGESCSDMPKQCTIWYYASTEQPTDSYARLADLASLLHAGVEHLLRDVKDSTVTNLSSEVSHMASGLRALKSRLSEVQQYLSLVLEGRLPVNHDIMYHLQVCY